MELPPRLGLGNINIVLCEMTDPYQSTWYRDGKVLGT